jgi:hypothetical protein
MAATSCAQGRPTAVYQVSGSRVNVVEDAVSRVAGAVDVRRGRGRGGGSSELISGLIPIRIGFLSS